jgi:N-acetylglucosaminyldiphosphoundecaprenol N-acetyl-beta-D-mannosaminyltransferase
VKASEHGVLPANASSPAAAHSRNSAALIVRGADGRRELDLGRDVHALMGLVFDRIDLAGAVGHVRRCVAERRPCFLSTPNVNFVAAAAHDAAFRDSVLHSDLSVADGFPIVRAARWMGIDLPGRVAGADIFERLQSAARSPQRPPIKLFLFGGPPGIAAAAAARLNAQQRGVECVGHDEGGFGDVQDMSSAATIERINASGADFVLVALGARKGQAWIEHNRSRLQAPVISHLGAVINFAADSVARAPGWMQRAGLEWAWRIYQEPQLWRRYASDGRLLARTLFTAILPSAARRVRAIAPAGAGAAPGFRIDGSTPGMALFALSGDWRAGADTLALRSALARALRDGTRVEIDLSAAPALDSALWGLIALVDAWQVSPRVVRAASLNDRILRADLRAHGMQYLLDAPGS